MTPLDDKPIILELPIEGVFQKKKNMEAASLNKVKDNAVFVFWMKQI